MTTRGQRLRAALQARDVTKQQFLAARLGIHESSLTRWMQDGPMALDSAMALATELDLSLDWLLLGRGSMDAPPYPGQANRMNAYAVGSSPSGTLLSASEIATLIQTVEQMIAVRTGKQNT